MRPSPPGDTMTPIRQPILIRSLTAALAGLSFGLMDHGRAAAQETAATAAPPPSVQVDRGSALYGRPEGGAAAKLAPVAGPPLAVAAANTCASAAASPEPATTSFPHRACGTRNSRQYA